MKFLHKFQLLSNDIILGFCKIHSLSSLIMPLAGKFLFFFCYFVMFPQLHFSSHLCSLARFCKILHTFAYFC